MGAMEGVSVHEGDVRGGQVCVRVYLVKSRVAGEGVSTRQEAVCADASDNSHLQFRFSVTTNLRLK